MPNPESASEFLRLAEESGVVDKPVLEKALKLLADKGADLSNASTLANSLVSNETLTRWQASKLLEGRHQGFTLGKYRLLSLLGKGSMGTVYLAEHTMMRRRVALKVLPFDHIQQPAYLDRFIREAQAVASLDHANIVRAYDVGNENEGNRDVYYLAMEYVDGQDLQKHVKENGPLEFVRAANLIRQAARGLSHAHDRGLTHRDVKPGNMLIDSDDVLKVLDLGLAVFHTADQDEEASLTVSNNDHLLGTADYISPEQARNSHEVDHRTDIYGLGCTFYFMLTGYPPFRQGTVAQRLLAHQTQTPPPVTETRPDFPADLETILNRMLAKSADDRFQTCHDIAGELKNWLLKNADDDWKSNHPEIFEANRISARSVLEDAEPADSTSDTMIGPSPFGDESGLLDGSVQQTSPPTSSKVERESLSRNQLSDKADIAAQPQLSHPQSSRPWIAIAVACLSLLIAGFFAVRSLTSDPSPAPQPAPNHPRPLITTKPTKPVTTDVATSIPSSTDDPTDSATLAPALDPVKPGGTPAATPVDNPKLQVSPKFAAWQELSEELKHDPDVVLYLSFQDLPSESVEDALIRNEAQSGSSVGIKLELQKKPEFATGRWPATTALHFDGGNSGQYLTVNEFDSGAFNISGSLSVLAWFKVAQFTGRYQCLISKGDYGFRLARHAESSGLAFAINRWGGTATNPLKFNGAVMTEAHDASCPVDDERWHLAVGVVNADADEITVSLFIDGELRNRRPSTADMDANPAPVLIGANSFFLEAKERKRTDGTTMTDPARQFMGSIDEIAVFSRVLTEKEIAHIYEVGTPE